MMLFPLFAAMLAASPPAAPAGAHATEVQSDFSDGLTEKFADALRHALPKAKNMRPEGGDDADDLFLTVLFKVDEDASGKRFGYAVDLLKANPPLTPDRLASFTGTCKTDAIDACALDLVREADRKAKD
jgi:hypothetical protein